MRQVLAQVEGPGGYDQLVEVGKAAHVGVGLGIIEQPDAVGVQHFADGRSGRGVAAEEDGVHLFLQQC